MSPSCVSKGRRKIMSIMSGWARWKPMELTAIAGKSAWSMIRQDSSAQILQLKVCRVSVLDSRAGSHHQVFWIKPKLLRPLKMQRLSAMSCYKTLGSERCPANSNTSGYTGAAHNNRVCNMPWRPRDTFQRVGRGVLFAVREGSWQQKKNHHAG